jgi:hypothetical protein
VSWNFFNFTQNRALTQCDPRLRGNRRQRSPRQGRFPKRKGGTYTTVATPLSCSSNTYSWSALHKYFLLTRRPLQVLAAYSTAKLPPAVYLHTADNYHRLTRPTFTGAQRPRREGDHGLPAALSPLVTPSKPAVWTHIACSQAPSRGCFPSPPRPHTPAGCGHGGTRKSRTSRTLQTWSVNPAAIAGVWGCHRLAVPLPLVGRGCGNGTRRLAWGKQKLSHSNGFSGSPRGLGCREQLAP